MRSNVRIDGRERSTCMRRSQRVSFRAASAVITVGAAMVPASIASASPAHNAAHTSRSSVVAVSTTLRIKTLGTRSNGQPLLTSSTPTGLPPSAIQSVYHLSGLSPASGAGAGQIIAIVDAYHDPNAL